MYSAFCSSVMSSNATPPSSSSSPFFFFFLPPPGADAGASPSGVGSSVTSGVSSSGMAAKLEAINQGLDRTRKLRACRRFRNSEIERVEGPSAREKGTPMRRVYSGRVAAGRARRRRSRRATRRAKARRTARSLAIQRAAGRSLADSAVDDVDNPMSETTSNARRRVEFDLPQGSGAGGEGGPPRHDPQSVEELLKGEGDDDSDDDDDIPEWQRESGAGGGRRPSCTHGA